MNGARFYAKFPESPGVYLMRNKRRKVLYVGKAGNLKRRVASYFLRAHDARIENLVGQIATIEYCVTDTALEALILEAKLIKKLRPPFNIKEKDDKSFLYVEISKERFPRVELVRGKSDSKGTRYGPFVHAGQIRDALRILRKIFPWNEHPAERVGKFARPCFDYQIGLCPGTCVGAVTSPEYRKTLRNLRYFFEGKKARIISTLTKEMERASKALEYERAARIRGQFFALRHIQDIAFIGERGPDIPIRERRLRIEGYDISNIAGTFAVGSMVVFSGPLPEKGEYRKFRIRSIEGANDTGMLHEVFARRFARKDWPLPDLLVVDGGRSQVNVARKALREKRLKIPVVGIIKGPARTRNDIIGTLPSAIERATIVRVRDEAHRFAIAYHKLLRARSYTHTRALQKSDNYVR